MMTMFFGAVTLIAVALLIVVSMASRSRAGDNAPAVGSAAPDFTLNSQEGKPVSLHDFKGKWVVLYFYPKDMTTGCTIEAHNFPARPGEVRGQGCGDPRSQRTG